MFVSRVEPSNYKYTFNKNYLCFKSRKLYYKTVLENSVQQIGSKISSQSSFTEKDIPWLSELSKVLRLPELINYQDLNTVRRHSWSGQILNYKEKLLDTLNVLLFTLHNKPVLKAFSDYKIQINNQEIGKLLRENYDKQTFNRLYNESDKHHCFDIDFNEYGFPITTPISEHEEKDMRVHTWITDTLRCANLIKDKYPSKYVEILNKISDFYKLEKDEFKLICMNPSLYATSKNDGTMYGVHHLFNPQNLLANKKYITCRIDSQGLYIEKIAEYLQNNPNTDYSKYTEPLIMNILYLYKINFPQCKTCGNWENSIMENLTSDTEIVRNGLQKLDELLQQNKHISKILNNQYKSLIQEWNIDEKRTFDEIVQTLLFSAQARLNSNYLTEYPENPKRLFDASLAFVSKTTKLDKDTIKDVEKNMELLNILDKYVGRNGIIRYIDDAYENCNYELAIDSENNIDFKNMKDRWYMIDKFPSALENKAEWFMVSDIGYGWAMQLNKLLNLYRQSNRSLTQEEKTLISICKIKQDEYINRSFARITGDNLLKANGKPAPSWSIPESYMSVSSNKQEPTFLPGTNTPLTWAKSSLYDFSQLVKENLNMIEELGISKILTKQ